MLVQVVNDLIKISTVVVDYCPAKAPTGECIDLGNGSSANDGYFLLEVSHGVKLCLILVDKTIVHFVGNNWHLVFIGHLEDL